MNSFQKFSQEHLKVLCQRGISTLIVFALVLKVIYSGVTIFSGVSFPFQDSLIATETYFHRMIIFCIITTALIFQLYHLLVQRAGLISKLVLILLLASLVVNLNSQYQAKSLFIGKEESVTELDFQQKCLNNSKLLWPSLSHQLYDEANKMNCSQNCPCTNKSDIENNQFANFQACLADSKSSIDSNVSESKQENISYSHTEQINYNQQYQKIAAMQKLSDIEQQLQCSGICESNQNYFFWDVSQKPQAKGTCYSIAANQIQAEILQYTKNYTLTIIFSIICTLIQEIFLYKSILIIQFAKSKLGACIALPITASQNFNQLNDQSEKPKQSEKKEQNIKIHLIDLSKKIIPQKNKEQKCILQIKVSPQLLKSESDIHSPECNNELPKIITENYKDSNPHEQN
ncbi:transmembrane protein, putative (macronuclear) [Tetrahymena thermophila SB210]|uniref:Transmembrane protein, putative n=1 Tax=Tetrahymena thermophila (strain SB210) TaxID=312017 RepID=Q236N1_TETTS|nr:transmembrane protein, putative [Tetrahymena thermophila SB210]EAR92469.1 transmembrane protein, putative [Tetrahymena thermophila SB210]|eukprot:XP_001012714.1 transmembrane protein, putative [Tetrahymena thermophila SB210]